MLDQRRRRWASIKSELGQRFVVLVGTRETDNDAMLERNYMSITWLGGPPEDGEMNRMSLSSRYRILNSSIGGQIDYP